MSFNQGHALIIGVGHYQNILRADVPIAVDDAHAVEQIIKDQKFCGYLETQVEILCDAAATRSGTLAALDRLAQRAGEADTVFLFYTGHGGLGSDGNYYLISYDAQVHNGRAAPSSCVSEAELIEKLRALRARRALLVFNTCHSGGIAPSLAPDTPEIESSSLPDDAASALLATGSGRIIITACRETQKSYVGSGSLTIFTQALVDGLHGKGVGNSSGFISAYDLYEHIYFSVTERVGEFSSHVIQEPELTVIKGVGPFAVALYKGASSLGALDENQPAPETPAVRQVKPEAAERSLKQMIRVRDGAVAIGKGAQAAGAGGIIIGGDVAGDVIGPGGRKTEK